MNAQDGTRRVSAAGVQLRVEIRNATAPRCPAIVLHGFTGCTESMAGVATPIAGDRPVVLVDLVGHGESDAPREVAPYRMAACVAQLAAVLDAFETSSAHWLGYSMGGRAALSLAVAHPERVRSLALVGASAGLATEAERAARRDADEALAASIERDGLGAFVDRWMALPLFASQKRLGERALASARTQRLRNRAHALANSLRGMGTGAQPALHDRLSELDIPVLLAAGDEDTKFLRIAEALEKSLPDARVARIPESGHACHLENPDATARAVREHFARAEA